jgi:hypothetical protein
MRLYILSDNWSMAMNDTVVFDFIANLTMVQAGDLDKQTFSLDKLTAVNSSDMLLGNNTMALTSPLDLHHANGTRLYATITFENLKVIKIQIDGMAAPIYRMVDKDVRNSNVKHVSWHANST